MKERNYYFDNLKAFLIISVVLGHLIEMSVDKSNFLRSLFLMIYTFHMPLFIFVSGFFAKSCATNKDKLFQRIINYLVLYVFFQTTIYLMNNLLYPNQNNKLSLFIVDGIAWYLLSLAIWHIFLIYIKDLKCKYVLPFIIILSLLVGYDSSVGDYLSLSRIIVYAPFFYLGYYLSEEKLSVFYNSRYATRIASIFIVLLYFIVLYKYDSSLYQLRPMFTGRNSYNAVGLDNGALLRILCYCITAIISFFIMLIIPKKKTIVSLIGQRTLQIYFIHKFVTMIYYYFNIPDLILSSSSWAKYIFIPLSILLTFILSFNFLSHPFKYISKLSKNIYFKIVKKGALISE